jgi:hypothetical protein
VHIDVDFMYPGGVRADRAVELAAATARELPVAAIAVTNHNAERDPGGETAAAAVRLLRAMASAFPSRAPR